MIALILKDGLGNQLFQYAAARALAARLGTIVKIDPSSYMFNPLRKYSLHHFCIEEQFVSSAERTAFRIRNRVTTVFTRLGIPAVRRRYCEEGFAFNPDFFQIPDNSWIEGYWQSENYFLPIEADIRREFVIKTLPSEQNMQLLAKIRDVNSVSLHVRRGDYITNPQANSLHGVCSLAYYQNAVALISARIPNPHFFIFSDDMDWTRQNLSTGGQPAEYIDHNGANDFEDLRLMYSCKHNITANSSFSWWGAWLNANPGKIVLVPRNWVKERYHNPDLIPPGWLQIEG